MSPEPASMNSCRQCGLQIPSASKVCWKCGARKDGRLAEQNFVTPPYGDGENTTASVGSPGTFGIASLLLVVSLVSVCMALIMAAPGLGVFLAVLSVVPLVRTIIIVNRRKGTFIAVDASGKIFLFISSLWVTFVIVIVVMATALFTFLFVCAATSPSFLDEPLNEGAVWFSAIVTVLVTGLVVWAFSYWIRGRWRRDA